MQPRNQNFVNNYRRIFFVFRQLSLHYRKCFVSIFDNVMCIIKIRQPLEI